MRGALLISLIVAGLMSCIELHAHHSFAATYVMEKDRIKTVEGKLVQIMLRNPHSFLEVEVAGENGQTTKWFIEAQGATQAKAYGGKRPLAVGDYIKVTFNPARLAESSRGRLVTILRPSDGWTWGTGTGEVVE
jgi:Family of unknown function (DUF6152)